MGIVSLHTIMDIVLELSVEQAKAITKGWISDWDKICRIAASDNRTPREVLRDAVTGMVGEWGSYLYFKHYGIDCEEPDCGIITRDKDSWDKDLLALCDVRIVPADGVPLTVDRSISCKAQLYSGTRRINEPYPSWTFQLPGVGHDGYKRRGDPMLLDKGANKLLVVSWIDDSWGEFGSGYVNYAKARVPYEDGFRWRPEVACFWWPEVFPYLEDPRKENLIGLKKCLYYKDIKHLRATVWQSYDIQH